MWYIINTKLTIINTATKILTNIKNSKTEINTLIQISNSLITITNIPENFDKQIHKVGSTNKIIRDITDIVPINTDRQSLQNKDSALSNQHKLVTLKILR